MMNPASKYWIDKLLLKKHPEGGYYREIYRSDESISELPSRFSGVRDFSTAIYFLLDGHDFSAFHRLKSDEAWHFYAGSPLIVHTLHPKSGYDTRYLGIDPEDHYFPLVIISRNTWFAAEVIDKQSFTLIGCTVAPGFDFTDFELAKREELITSYPDRKDLITRLTRS